MISNTLRKMEGRENTYRTNQTLKGYKRVHGQYERGYRDPMDGSILEPYSGEYGVGYKRHEPTNFGCCDHWADIWIKEV